MTGIRGFNGWVGTVLGSPDPVALGRFYESLLGWPIRVSDPTWVTMVLRDQHGEPTRSNLAFQLEDEFEPPVWPSEPGHQQMQFHLDLAVTDVAAAVEDAVALGARLASFQPQAEVRVMLDPDGHPFCLWLDESTD